MKGKTEESPPRAAVRVGHFVFVAVILAYAIWYAFDALATVERMESAMAVVVCAALTVVLGLAILIREVAGRPTAETAQPAGAEETGAEETGAGETGAGEAATGEGEAGEPLANPILLAAATVAYVILIILMGIEVPTFLFLAATAWLLGSRSLLFITFYSAALTGLLVWMVHFFATPPDAYFRLFG